MYFSGVLVKYCKISKNFYNKDIWNLFCSDLYNATIAAESKKVQGLNQSGMGFKFLFSCFALNFCKL